MILAASFLLLTVAARAQEGKENSDFKLAVNLYDDGMYDLAVEQLKNFIAVYPATSNGIEARFYLGLTQMKLQRYDDARQTFQNFALAYVDHPKAPDAWMKVAEAFSALENVREAASAYERVKVFHPKSALVPDALLNAGKLYRQLGERDLAKKALRAIIQDYPTSKSALPARLAIGEMYAEEGQTELAEAEARRVSESDAPASVKASALFSIGKLQFAASLFDDAEATFKSVLTNYKGTSASIAATFELGRLAMSSGNYSSAVESFKKVSGEDAADDSLQARAFFEMGNAYATMREYSDAQKSYERLVSKYPKSPLVSQAMLDAGWSALLNEKYKDALKNLTKILSLPASPLKPQALVLAARSAIALKQFNDAIKHFNIFIESYPQNDETPRIILDLGSLYEDQLGDCRKAISVYDDIVQKYAQSPYVVEAMMRTAKCQESLNDYEAALKTYSDLQRSYPANDGYDIVTQRIEFIRHHRIKDRDAGMEKLARLIGEVLTEKSKGKLAFQLGEIYFNDLKDYSSAVKQFSAAIDAGIDQDEFIEAYFHRARALHFHSEIDSSNEAQAILYYDSFLKQFPKSKWSEDAAYYSFLLKSGRKQPQNVIQLSADFQSKFPSSSHRDEIYLMLGKAAMEVGGFPDALQAFSFLVHETPKSPLTAEALLEAGIAYAQLNKIDSAKIMWQKAAALRAADPSPGHAAWNLAEQYKRERNYPDAIALWKKLSTEYFYCGLGKRSGEELPQAYVANGDYDEAIDLYESLLQQQESSSISNDVDPNFRLNLAEAYEKKGDRQKATRYYSEFLLRNKKSDAANRAFYALGVLARAQGKTTAASSYFKQAAALGGSSSASFEIAALMFQTEQYAEAVKQFTRLAQATDSIDLKKQYTAKVIVATLRMDKLAEGQKLTADFEKTFGKDKECLAEFEYEKGNHYYRKEDYSNAKKAFENLADDYEDTRFGPWGHFYLGKIQEVNSKFEDAAKRYENILKKYPSSDVIPRVLLSLGNMHFNAERFEDAIRYYQQITAMPEKTGDILPYAMNNLVEAYESTKLYDAALKTTREFIERFPNDESIVDKKIKIGALYTKIGYYDQAVLQFQNLLDETGSMLEAELHYNIGEAYYYKGDYQQAILEFLKVPYLVARQGKVNWTATSFYMAGQAYEKMSKFDEAVGMYQQILDRSGIDATFKAAARKEIDRVKSLMKRGSK